MGLPYENAAAGDRALAEMQKTLAAFGCQSFGTMTDNERGCMIVAFKWRDRQVHLEANWKGYAVAWQKAHPYSYRSNQSRAQYDEKALKQAKVAICSILRDWVKGQTTAIECGVLSFEAAFMPHMLLKDGQRVLDAAHSRKPTATA
jgi:hypothetical protein